MRNYIRDKTKGGCYFLTFNLANRQSQLLLTHIDKFRDAYAKTIQHHRFDLDAMAVLLDHVHMLITLPSDSDNYAVIIASLKSQFSRQIDKTEAITPSRHAKRERGIWQRRFWEHRVIIVSAMTLTIDNIWIIFIITLSNMAMCPILKIGHTLHCIN